MVSKSGETQDCHPSNLLLQTDSSFAILSRKTGPLFIVTVPIPMSCGIWPFLRTRSGGRESSWRRGFLTNRQHRGSDMGLRLVSPTQREASIGYVLRRDCWGRGYATEAGRGLLRFGFERIKAHRIFASCDVEHVRSIRVLEKLGMTREGRHRQDTWYPSSASWRDSYYYAILEDEWIGRQ